MADYYLNENQQSNGDNEVHKSGCAYMPRANIVYLGDFSNCFQAVARAKQVRPNYKRINGCYYCSRECHTS